MPSSQGFREVGDRPLYTDDMFNFVPGSCFEIGTSLTMLDTPGAAGKLFDVNAQKVAEIIRSVYETELGQLEICFSEKATPIKLIDYFKIKIMKELHPASDQIGRCLDGTKRTNWNTSEGLSWVLGQLRLSSSDSSYSFANMLTKIRTIAAMGAILRELMPLNKETAARLISKDINTLTARNSHLVTKIRHAEFDNSATRARAEKIPVVQGKGISSHPEVGVTLTDAALKGIGFGQIWHADTMVAKNNKGQILIEEYKRLEKEKGRQGMERRGQDIKDTRRPGLLGESSLKIMPRQFKNAGLIEQLDGHRFEHGSGINRWRLHGSYPMESYEQALPTAGAHSGTTSDIFMALNCLEERPLFGKPVAKTAGLLISSFMNFGGYHSFVETFPIAQAIAQDRTFDVKVTKSHRRHLYQDIVNTAKSVGVGDSMQMTAYYDAYKEIVRERIESAKHPLPSPTLLTAAEIRDKRLSADSDLSSAKQIRADWKGQLAKNVAASLCREKMTI